MLGETKRELGGSEYYALHGAVGNSAPKVDAAKARKLYNALHSAISQGLVASCHDCSDGGIAVALAESAFAGGLGIEADADKIPTAENMRNDELLFSESASRFVVTVQPENRQKFEKALEGNSFALIGSVTPKEELVIKDAGGKAFVHEPIEGLKKEWKKTLDW